MNRLSIDGTKTAEKYRLYLDVDGVLLGRADPTRKRKTVAHGAVDFLSFAKDKFDCYWLTPHCHGEAAAVREYIGRHYLNRGDLDYLLTKVKPTIFATPRTRLFAEGEKFYWLTPEISSEEEEDLESRGRFNNHVQIDTRKDFNALDGARDFLRKELGLDA